MGNYSKPALGQVPATYDSDKQVAEAGRAEGIHAFQTSSSEPVLLETSHSNPWCQGTNPATHIRPRQLGDRYRCSYFSRHGIKFPRTPSLQSTATMLCSCCSTRVAHGDQTLCLPSQLAVGHQEGRRVVCHVSRANVLKTDAFQGL